MKKLIAKEPKRMSDGLPDMVKSEFGYWIQSKIYDDWCNLYEFQRAIDKFLADTEVEHQPQVLKMCNKLKEIFIERRDLQKRLNKTDLRIARVS